MRLLRQLAGQPPALPAGPAVTPMALNNADMRNVLATVFKHYLAHKLHVPMLFWGAAGVGKTAAVPQAAEELSKELGRKVKAVIIKPGQADSAGDILGMPEKVDYYPCPWCLQASEASDEYARAALDAHARRDHGIKTWEETHEALASFGDRIQVRQRFAITDVWPTTGPVLVCIDEVNRASPDIRNALFGLINERNFELSGYRLPEEAIVFATANPSTAEYSDTHELDWAMVTRFVHFQVTPTPEEWLDFMAEQQEAKTEAGAKALGFFREHPEFITPKDGENPVLAKIQATNRTCTALVRLSNILSGRLLAEAAAGTIGPKAAGAFMQHMNKREEWVRCKDILAGYEKVRPAILEMRQAGRNDMFLQTQEDIIRHLSKREKTLRDSEVASFVEFLRDLLADQVWSLLAGLLREEAKAEANAPIKRHISVLYKDRGINTLVAEHNKRVNPAKA